MLQQPIRQLARLAATYELNSGMPSKAGQPRHMCCCASSTVLASGQSEVNCDLGVDFNRFSVQEVRLVAPLLHCIDSGLRQHWHAAFDSNILHASILGDDGQ